MITRNRFRDGPNSEAMPRNLPKALVWLMLMIRMIVNYVDLVRITIPYSPDFRIRSPSMAELSAMLKQVGIPGHRYDLYPGKFEKDESRFSWITKDGRLCYIDMYCAIVILQPTAWELRELHKILGKFEHGISRVEVAQDFLFEKQSLADEFKAVYMSHLALPYASRKRSGTIDAMDYFGNEPTEGVKRPRNQGAVYADKPARLIPPEHPELIYCCHQEHKWNGASVVKSHGVYSLEDLANFNPPPFLEERFQLFDITRDTIPDHIRKNRPHQYAAFMVRHEALVGTEIVGGRIVKLQNYLHEVGLIMKALGIPKSALQYIKRRHRIDVHFLYTE
ncbi:MAG: hypothetical protein H7834_05560 [Magnetococcus sp. YQC-9]